MNYKKPNIAVDGYSSTGKSSISKSIADELGLIHIDTGALYRGITLYALQNCQKDGQIDFSCLHSNLDGIRLEFHKENSNLLLYLNHQDVSKEIRTQAVSENVSQIAKEKEIRAFLLRKLREMANKGGMIMDGRDIGTVVLPDADYKFFLTASVEERTKRRYLELQSLGIEMDYDTVQKNLLARDKADTEREISPLVQAKDAILIDNTFINKEETIQLMLSNIHQDR